MRVGIPRFRGRRRPLRARLARLVFALTVISWAYSVASLWFTRAIFRQRHGPETPPGDHAGGTGAGGAPYTPAVSILKPVKGLDYQAYENFASYCRQDYPSTYEMLFAVASPGDPSIPVIRQLQEDFPEMDIRLVTQRPRGTNRKAGMLESLAEAARYDVLVAADSDMRVEPDYLRRVVGPLADPGVGLVTCLYRGSHRRTLTARLEALYIGASYVPYVAVGRWLLRMRFALGATMVFRREALEAIGGFRAVDEYLADDYQLGRRISLAGWRVHLSDYLVEYVVGAPSFLEEWQREARWARCIRASRRLEYPLLVLSFATPLGLLYGPVAGPRRLRSWLPGAASLTLRWVVGWVATGYSGDREIRPLLPLLPLRDGLSALVWLSAAFSRRVVWRGEVLEVSPDGRLELPAEADGPLSRLARRGVFSLERALRRHEGIFEFTQDDSTLFRLARTTAQEDVLLRDGVIPAGTPVAEFHFWNEHIPPLPAKGPTLAWASTFRRNMRATLEALARAVDTDPRLEDVEAFFGVTLWPGQYEPEKLVRMVGPWGFDYVPREAPAGLPARAVRVGDGIYRLALSWAFTPDHQDPAIIFNLERPELWLSRRVLLDKFGPESDPDQEPAAVEG